MCEETKKLENLENTELTDEQTENISGGWIEDIPGIDGTIINGKYIIDGNEV